MTEQNSSGRRLTQEERDPSFAAHQARVRASDRVTEAKLHAGIEAGLEYAFECGTEVWSEEHTLEHMIGKLHQWLDVFREPTTPAQPSKRPIPSAIRWEVYERDNFTCQRCAVRRDLCIDHIHPESLGGTQDLDNLQTLCRRCNSSKGARPA